MQEKLDFFLSPTKLLSTEPPKIFKVPKINQNIIFFSSTSISLKEQKFYLSLFDQGSSLYLKLKNWMDSNKHVRKKYQM